MSSTPCVITRPKNVEHCNRCLRVSHWICLYLSFVQPCLLFPSMWFPFVYNVVKPCTVQLLWLWNGGGSLQHPMAMSEVSLSVGCHFTVGHTWCWLWQECMFKWPTQTFVQHGVGGACIYHYHIMSAYIFEIACRQTSTTHGCWKPTAVCSMTVK